MNEPNEVAQKFLSFSRYKLLEEMWPRLCSALDPLTEEQIWWRPNEASNSIGNLLLHLNGNLRQWILQGIGGIANSRDRDAEFREAGNIPIAQLRSRLETTLQEVDRLLASLPGEDLLRTYNIQVYENVSALDAIYHVIEHFAMHYGQILYIAKLVGGRGLGFYDHLSAPKI